MPGSLVLSNQYSNDRHLISLLICIYISFKFISNMSFKNHLNNFILLIIFLSRWIYFKANFWNFLISLNLFTA